MSRGFRVIPVRFASKTPVNAGWPTMRLSKEELPQHFAGPINIGVLNGAPSRRLVDVDLDAPEAIALARYFLPATGLIFGRRSKPRSHWEYRTDKALKTKRFRDVDGKPVVEMLVDGTQTVWPRSKHPSGETVSFAVEEEAAHVSSRKLARSIRRLAACTLIARHWPKKAGQRHEIANALAGLLLRGGLDQAASRKLVARAAEIAGDEQWRERGWDVVQTAKSMDKGKSVTAGPHLAELIGDRKVVETLAGWLRLKKTHVAAPRDQGAAARKLPFRTAAEIARTAPRKTRWLVKPWVAFGATTELAGKVKKAGKSTLVSHLVQCVLVGKDFLGEPTRKSGVIWLTEQPRSSFDLLLRRAALLGRNDLTVLYWHEVSKVAWPDIVGATVREARRRGARLIVVDTLTRFAALGGDNENRAGDAEKAIGPLVVAAAKHDLGIVLIRHERKSGGEVGDAARGSSAFSGGVDIVLLLRRMENGPRKRIRVLHALSRFDETPDQLAIELGNDGYIPLGNTDDVIRQQARKRVLVELPRKATIAMTLDELLKKTKEKRTTVQLCLRELLEQKKIRRVGEGHKGDGYRYYRHAK